MKLDTSIRGHGRLQSRERHTGYETIKQRRDRTNTWVLELLRAVDHYGLLRKPTWDGVQVLLLLLPLTEGSSIVHMRA